LALIPFRILVKKSAIGSVFIIFYLKKIANLIIYIKVTN